MLLPPAHFAAATGSQVACLRMYGGGFVPNPICYKSKAACESVKRQLVAMWRKKKAGVKGTCTVEKKRNS
ncbi:MAG: hypothetical protein HC855_03555 [Rhizobiales bacterium]|nr:hypothetical protein [Hyphomicrobiales bacterium]